MKKFDKVLTKIKLQAFCKITIDKNNDTDKELNKLLLKKKKASKEVASPECIEDIEREIAEKIIMKQRIEYEGKLTELTKIKNNKGNCASVFKLKENVLGSKKAVLEATSMIDPKSDSKNLLVGKRKVMEAAVN